MNHSRKTLTFVRHGESVANAGGMTMPHHAIPLSATGRQQATELPALIDVQPSVVLVSNMIRTHETAAPFCERHAIVPKINPTLDEFSVIDPALIEGMDGAQRKPFVKSYWDDPQPHKRLGDKADMFPLEERAARRAQADAFAFAPHDVLIMQNAIEIQIDNQRHSIPIFTLPSVREESIAIQIAADMTLLIPCNKPFSYYSVSFSSKAGRGRYAYRLARASYKA